MEVRPIRRLVFALASFALLAQPSLAQSAAGREGDFARASQVFRTNYLSGLRKAGFVGSSFYFVRDNRVVVREHYGLADDGRGVPVGEDTIYHWASITKTFTGIAVMQLRDRGLLRLDDPVVKYLPELRAAHNPFGDMSEVTIRHLMTHSAGFRNPTWTWRDDSKGWQPFEPPGWAQLAAMMPYTEVLFRPGSKFSYSNPGVIYLGRIVELLTHEDYEVYIDKNIFKPLEMHRSYFDATPYHLLRHRSHSYYVSNGVRKEARFDADTGVTVSNGGLNAPLPDMVKYINFLVGDPSKQATYDGVLKRSSLEEMWRPQRLCQAVRMAVQKIDYLAEVREFPRLYVEPSSRCRIGGRAGMSIGLAVDAGDLPCYIT